MSIRDIRESLNYFHKFQNKRIIIHLDTDIEKDVKKYGIISDIALVKKAGIEVIITHTSNKITSNDWPSIETLSKDFNQKEIKDLDRYFLSILIPVIQCQALKKMSIDEIIINIALTLQANKIIFISKSDGIFYNRNGQGLIKELSIAEANQYLRKKIITGKLAKRLIVAINACKNGIDRIHFISGFREGSLLKELFSSEGIGTMLYSKLPYQEFRQARITDCLILINILTQSSIKIFSDYSEISKIIKNFTVFVADDNNVHGCFMVKRKKNIMEILYLATSEEYNKQIFFEKILKKAIEKAKKENIKTLIINLEKNSIWLRVYTSLKKIGFKKNNNQKLILTIELV